MAKAKTTKVKSNQQIAYELQKFLKQISIKLKFLDEIEIWADGDSLSFSSKIENFFLVEGKTKVDADNALFNFLSSNKNKRAILNFKNDGFLDLKKSLKKDVLEYEASDNSLKIVTEKENVRSEFNINLTSEISKLSNKYRLVDLHSDSIKLTPSEPALIAYDSNNRKILELPTKSIVGYSDGEIIFKYLRDTDIPGIINCSIEYSINENINQKLYFSAIYY